MPLDKCPVSNSGASYQVSMYAAQAGWVSSASSQLPQPGRVSSGIDCFSCRDSSPDICLTQLGSRAGRQQPGQRGLNRLPQPVSEGLR